MANNHLNESVRDAIVEEVLKDYDFKSPSSFMEDIIKLADKHMTDKEKKLLEVFREVSEVFPTHITEFSLRYLAQYLQGCSIVIPRRLSSGNSDFMAEAAAIGDEAKEVHVMRSQLISAVKRYNTVSKFKQNLPQFVPHLERVLKQVTKNVPADPLDMAKFDKYKKVQNESRE